jgi:DNA-binding transcriptional ArsR family regulator
VIPDCTLPLPETGSSSGNEALEAIAETRPEVLTEQLWSEFGPTLPHTWRAVEAQPRRWLRAYAWALTRATRAAAPIWQAATALIEREVERVGVAVVNGSIRELLAMLHPEYRLDGDCLTVPRRSEGDEYLHPSSQGLTLIPMVCGSHSRLVACDGSAITHLGYPVPGLDRLLSGDKTTSHGLAALVGPARTRLLSALDRPAHAGTLADVLEAVPSAVTHHLGVLEASGLIVRERNGRRVVVRRTARGSALLALYGG